MINEGIVNVSYIIATILFILALGGLSSRCWRRSLAVT
jgi:NAD/NADP transhydrogenase beta subunit